MSGEHTLGDGPIEAEFKARMNAVGEAVHEVFNGRVPIKDAQVGFVLLVFPMHDHDGRCNYISSARREDIVVLLREQLARFEGSPDVVGRG